ncbi:MAG: hypothetical protein JXA92_11395 [candidate division Zixibacteria bacterium]|nr:hypothetical protein [candidate division Zixibacteria bacterium]
MKRLLFLMALLICGLTFVLFSGCSDDDDETNPVIEGDPDAEEFQFFENAVSNPAMEINKYALFTTMALLDSFVLPEVPGKNGPRFVTAEGDPLIVFDSVSVDSSNFWIIFYFEFTIMESEIDYSETLYVYGTDSLKVYENDEAVYALTGEPDSVDAREHFHVEYNDSDESAINCVGHHSLRIGGAQPDSTVFNAYSIDSIMSYFVPDEPGLSLCSLRVISETDIDDLALPLNLVDESGDICPIAGNLELTTNLGLGCVGDSTVFNVNGEWTMSLSYGNGVESVTVTFGNTVWHWEGPCE